MLIFLLQDPQRKRSQSEWNISDTSSLDSSRNSRVLGHIDESEAEALLPVPSLGLNKDSGQKQSQYFDALETIDENDDSDLSNNIENNDTSDSDSSSSSSWETDSSDTTTGEIIFCTSRVVKSFGSNYSYSLNLMSLSKYFYFKVNQLDIVHSTDRSQINHILNEMQNDDSKRYCLLKSQMAMTK